MSARAARPRPLAPRIFLALARFSFVRSGLGYLVICPPTVYAVARLDMDILPPLRGWTAEGGGSHRGDAYMEMQENPASRKGRQTWGTEIHFSASIGSSFVARCAGR